MRERESYPAGVPCWIDTNQPDVPAAVDFYSKLFGWKCEDQMPPGSDSHYFVATIDGFTVAGIGGPAEAGAAGAPPAWNTYVAVDDVDQSTARARTAGGTVLSEPFDVMDAGRMSVIADLGGAPLRLWEAKATIGSQLVNEFGTWNFSDLNTRDPKAASRFYGALFGWEVEVLEGSAFTIFRLPGYGDFLEKRDPELRKRLEEGGGPDGFADAVAMLATMGADVAAETPEHWSVTFAVDDADATAKKAERLGGTVVVPPFDVAPVRMTVITDPQGATFTASKYQPEATA
jgi:predicted enzyme related to lactoylglutathione lyase